MAAQAIGVRHALRIEHSADLMGRVTIYAGRQHVGLLLPQLAANGLAVHGLYLRMALGARGGNILARDG